MKKFFCCTLFLLSLSFASTQAIPPLSGPVIDQAKLLNSSEVQKLSQQLQSYLGHIQLQVWTVPALENNAIEQLSIKAVEKWKLGGEKKDNGALILISKADRQMRIEVGHGLEGEITDLAAGRIVDQIMAPAFRTGNFAYGISAAAQTLYELSGGSVSANPETSSAQFAKTQSKHSLAGIIFFLVFLMFFIFVLYMQSLTGFRSGRSSRTYWGGGGGGWSSGGGGWSGGGGSFGGGGASGRW
jgi:uncharacterized protein